MLLVVLAMAYANGANDNFKGVATLFGSGTTDYRRALLWATLWTFSGSLTAVFLAGQLLKNFSGRGLVDSSLVSDPQYVGAVALGAGMTVLLATRVGMPIDHLHYFSAGAVSFARGLNDTSKIAALLLVAPLFGGVESGLVVALPMALGGLLSARRVAEVMSRKITPMNHGQGFVANLVTSAIVIVASRFGMPVSTTHVSCGALFGIGAVTRRAHPRMIATILSAWVTTLPVAALLGAIAFRVLVSI